MNPSHPEYTLTSPLVQPGNLNRSNYFTDLDQSFIRRVVHRKIDPETHLALPLRMISGENGKPGILEIAMVKPHDTRAQDYLVRILSEESHHCNVHVREIPENALKRAVDYVFGVTMTKAEVDEDEDVVDENRAEDETAILIDKPSDLISIRQMRQWLREAINTNSTDLHLEANKSGGRVRIRQDGRLVDHKGTINGADYAQMVSWLKIQARKDIAEKRLPQDGGFFITTGLRRVDVRFSSIPTIFGEKIVLRFLDSEGEDHPAKKGLAVLINRPEFLQIFENALNTPEGIILVTGPTGSGKTTTLFGCLNYLRDKFGSEYNITTVEDPVEYRIEGVNHVEVKPEIGFTFASSLRSIVRQDPDFLMIGEIRDKDTAEIAMQSALTGHLVLSTLHTNNALGAVPRLLDLGARPFMLASTVILLQAQRLIRKLCPKCGHNQTLTEKEIAEKLRHNGMMHRRDELMATPVYKPYHEGKRRGCDACENSGYKGRLAVMELLPIMPKMKELIERQASLLEMTQYAVSQGFRLLVEHGLDHVKEGTCSLDEALELTPSNYEHVAPASPVTVSMSTPEVTGSPRAKQTHSATSPPPAMRPPVRTAGRAGKSRVIVID